MKSRHIQFVFLILLLIGLSSCSSFGQAGSGEAEPAKIATEPTPTPTPPKKKPEMHSHCKVSDGAGRIFNATDDARELAESKARHQCEIYSRHCVLLDCSTDTDENDE